jgi:hypothetical protein
MKMRFGSTVAFVTVPGVALTLALVAGGCGGIVREGGDSPDSSPSFGSGGFHGGSGSITGSGGRIGTAASPGTGARPTTSTGGTVAKPACGNGKIEPGEGCDGVLPPGATCSSATMGAKPIGTLTCTKGCMVSTAQCTSQGTGGFTGTGGFPSKGGSTGSGGVTYDVCLNAPTTILPNACTAPCGCKVCPDAYAACRADGGCAWILACAQQQGCASVATCYSTSCGSIINTAGGLMSVGARLADPALACLAQSGCGVACR